MTRRLAISLLILSGASSVRAQRQRALTFFPIPIPEQSGFEQAETVLVRDQNQWEALRARLRLADPFPAIDFRRDSIIGIFAGVRPTAGYSIRIDSITADPKGSAMVRYRLLTPPADALLAEVLTYPNLIVRVPTVLTSARFLQR